MKKNYNKYQIIYGPHSIIEAIEAGRPIEKILLKKDFTSPLLSKLRSLAKNKHIPIQYVPKYKIDKITKSKHQGVVAIVSPVKFWTLDQFLQKIVDKHSPLLIMLDRVTDVRNFGAIVRTAECASVSGIIIPTKNTASISADAMKTSAGALNHITLIREPKLFDALVKLKKNHFQIIAASEKGDKLYYQIDYTLPTVIILGSEEKGINPRLLSKADQIAKIPLLGKIQSLNVSVAAGIFIFEAVKQRINSTNSNLLFKNA